MPPRPCTDRELRSPTSRRCVKTNGKVARTLYNRGLLNAEEMNCR